MAGVPKFGDWNTGNESNLFTAKFEEARFERGSGAAKQRFGRGDERLGYGVGRDNEEPRYGFDRADGRVGGRGKIMNPNDPLENPGAFFGNKAIKPKNMSQENNQHNHGFPVVNAQLRQAKPSPARNVAPNLAAPHNRFKQPSPSATPPRVNPSGIPANRGHPVPKFGQWDEKVVDDGFSNIFMNAARGQTSTQFGMDPVKMEVDDDVRRKRPHKKSHHNDHNYDTQTRQWVSLFIYLISQ